MAARNITNSRSNNPAAKPQYHSRISPYRHRLANNNLSIYRHVRRQETLVHYSRLHWGLHVRNYDAYILYSQTGAHSEHHFSVRTFLSPQERKDVVKEKCLEFESGVFLRLLILACPPGLTVQPTTACCHRLPLVSEAQSPLSVSVVSALLYVHRNHQAYLGRGAQNIQLLCRQSAMSLMLINMVMTDTRRSTGCKTSAMHWYPLWGDLLLLVVGIRLWSVSSGSLGIPMTGLTNTLSHRFRAPSSRLCQN